MDSLTTHPATAQQAKAFTSPASLSFPGGAPELAPQSQDFKTPGNGVTSTVPGTNAPTSGISAPAVGAMAGSQQASSHPQSQGQSSPVMPTQDSQSPVTPNSSSGPGVSGIVPTLQ
ncbi:TATA-box-binding protein [Ascosphaera atra]|nr:TATA-box-binding protein [Ascosphaera atra]